MLLFTLYIVEFFYFLLACFGLLVIYCGYLLIKALFEWSSETDDEDDEE
jgi:hypothetical protein